MLRMIFNFLVRYLSDKKVEKYYVKAGADFGDAVSYIYMGECIGFRGMLRRWTWWEKEYSHRGYRTISIDDFIGYGGYGKELSGLGVKLKQGEKAVLHAEIYKDRFLRKVVAQINLQELLDGDGKPQVGHYCLPGTKNGGA